MAVGAEDGGALLAEDHTGRMTGKGARRVQIERRETRSGGGGGALD